MEYIVTIILLLLAGFLMYMGKRTSVKDEVENSKKINEKWKEINEARRKK